MTEVISDFSGKLVCVWTASEPTIRDHIFLLRKEKLLECCFIRIKPPDTSARTIKFNEELRLFLP